MDDHARFPHPKTLNDLGPYWRAGGCGEREDSRAAKRFDRLTEVQVLRPEVLSPLADTVRFVYDKEGWL
jgi:hypothetical protein